MHKLSPSVRILATYSLLFTFAVLGTGALEYLHNWAHELEDQFNDRAQDLLECKTPSPCAGTSAEPVHHEHHHDESNCEVHAQLHMALIVHAGTPLLISLGLLIAFLTLLARPLIPRALPVRIDCRGPPGFCGFTSI